MRRLPQRWRAALDVAAVQIAVLTFLLAALAGKVENLGGWDETYYLTQLSSLVEDGDLDLRNDALWATLPPTELRRLLMSTLPSGALANTFSIGPALLFTPAYLAGLPVRLWAGPDGARWSGAQVAALHLLALALAFWTLWWLRSWLRRAGLGRAQALLATTALAMGTPFLIYGFRHYAGSHLASAVAACAFVAAVVRLERRRDLGSALICGTMLGLVFLARWQDLVMAVALAIPALRVLRERDPARALALIGASLAPFVAVAGLQFHAWGVERGQLFAVPQGSGYLNLAQPELANFLFSGRSGLLPWSPLIGLCLLGLLLPWRLRLPRGWALVSLIVLAAEIYLNACVTDWWGGSSYGARRMTSTLPFLALGLANLMRQRRGARRAPTPRAWTAALLLLCLWGAVTAQLYRGGVQDLAPLFLGRPSTGASPAIDGSIDRDSARQALRFPLSFRLPKYFDAPVELGRLAAVVAMAAVLALAVRAATRRRRHPRIDAARRFAPRRHGAQLAAIGVLALAAAFHLRLAAAPPADIEERANWRKFASAAGAPTPDHALLDREARRFGARAAGSGGSADPYRYLYLWSLWQRNRAGRAQTQLQELAARGYPAAAALVDLGLAAGPYGTIRLALPGVLLGRADSELRLRLRGERALSVRRVVVAAELRFQESASGPLVAILAGPTVIARLDFQGGDSVVSTPAVAVTAPAGWRSRRDLRFSWDATREQALAEMGKGARFGPPLIVPGAAPASYDDDELAVAFAPQHDHGGAGAQVANLFVITAPRQNPW